MTCEKRLMPGCKAAGECSLDAATSEKMLRRAVVLRRAHHPAASKDGEVHCRV